MPSPYGAGTSLSRTAQSAKTASIKLALSVRPTKFLTVSAAPYPGVAAITPIILTVSVDGLLRKKILVRCARRLGLQ